MPIGAPRRIGDLTRELLPLPCPVKCAFHYFIRATPPALLRPAFTRDEVGCYSLPVLSLSKGYSLLFPTVLQIGH